jgi:hypothetical protein
VTAPGGVEFDKPFSSGLTRGCLRLMLKGCIRQIHDDSGKANNESQQPTINSLKEIIISWWLWRRSSRTRKK